MATDTHGHTQTKKLKAIEAQGSKLKAQSKRFTAEIAEAAEKRLKKIFTAETLRTQRNKLI